jgi:hypothetical protein
VLGRSEADKQFQDQRDERRVNPSRILTTSSGKQELQKDIGEPVGVEMESDTSPTSGERPISRVAVGSADRVPMKWPYALCIRKFFDPLSRVTKFTRDYYSSVLGFRKNDEKCFAHLAVVLLYILRICSYHTGCAGYRQ